MDPNTHSTSTPEGLTALAAAVDRLAAQDLHGRADAARAERVLVLRRLLDRLEGHWLHELADLDAGGAAGAEAGVQAGSTAGWLRHRLRMGAGAANRACAPPGPCSAAPHRDRHRPGRRGTLGRACQRAGPRHPGVGCPGHRRGRTGAGGGGPPPGSTPAAAGPGPPAPGGRPDTADRQAQRGHARRGLWLASTLEGMVAVEGLLEPEAGQLLLAALEP
jgi:hypothetical protein